MEIAVKVNYKNDNLQHLRQNSGLSQSQLAKLAGVSVRVYQNYEQGVRDISKAQLVIRSTASLFKAFSRTSSSSFICFSLLSTVLPPFFWLLSSFLFTQVFPYLVILLYIFRCIKSSWFPYVLAFFRIKKERFPAPCQSFSKRFPTVFGFPLPFTVLPFHPVKTIITKPAKQPIFHHFHVQNLLNL